MSEETRAALEEALRAHVASDEGGNGHTLLTGWYVLTAAVSAHDPDTTDYRYACSDQPAHSALGLLYIGLRRLINEVEER